MDLLMMVARDVKKSLIDMDRKDVNVSALGLSKMKQVAVALLPSPQVNNVYLDGSFDAKANISISYRMASTEENRADAVKLLDGIARALISKKSYNEKDRKGVRYDYGIIAVQATPPDVKDFIDYRIIVYIYYTMEV